MKNLILPLALLISSPIFAVEVDVISAEIGIEDEAGRPELCLTLVRSPETSAVIGIVETKYDCFYTRKARKLSRIEVNHKYLSPVEPSLLHHLQSRDPSVEFVFSDGE